MSRIKVIVNPNAGHGHGSKLSPLIDREFASLGADYDLVHTTGRGHAVELARRALDDSYDTVVAVGGDGTSHEVVNGMMAQANGSPVGVLGCIPAGSGNDFALANGTPLDVAAACRQIVEGRTKCVDVGQVTVDGEFTRYFDNAVGVGFDAMVTAATYRHPRLHGLALYLPSVLETVFVNMRRPLIHARCDQQAIEQTATMMIICNGRQEGGAFQIAPEARTDDGLLDLVIVDAVSRLKILSLIPRFMKGTHMADPRIRSVQGREVELSSNEPLVYHIDGEIPTPGAHHIVTRILPGRLTMIAPEG